MPNRSMQDIINQANRAVWEHKETQFRTLVLALSVLVFLAVAYEFYRVLALGLGNPKNLIASALALGLILSCLLPSNVLTFKNRIRALILSGFVTSVSATVTAGTLGSGYIVFVLDAFMIHYFLEKKPATILILCLLTIMVGISLLRVVGLLPPLPVPSEATLNGFTVSKILVAILTVVSLHFMDSSSANILKKSVADSLAAGEKLRAEQVATNKYLESIPGIFFLFDGNWQLVRWNGNLSTVTGFTPEELKGREVLTFFDADQQIRLREKISDIFVRGAAYAEGDLCAKDGTRHPFAFNGRSVEIDGQTFACGIGLDLSEKRQLEKEVQEAQKMEALGALAGGVAHDLNNVLGGIIGYSEIVKANIADGKMPNIKHMQVILQSCQRGAGIVQQILLFTRRTEEKKIPLNLYSVVRDAVKLIRHTIPRTIEIKDRLAKGQTVINADPNQMHQVVMNICTNAWHAMRETGGELGVSIASVDVSRDDIPVRYNASPGSYQKLIITDTGVGIPADKLETIFDPFFTSKPVGEGTGLGLAVVEKIVKKHGGFIQIDSKVGKGTVFSVFFPIHDYGTTPDAGLDTEALPRGTETILVVDDEPAIREANKIILEGLGYIVFTAENGEEGLLQFKEHQDRIKLVITDFSMPRKNGGQMVGEIRTIKADMPVLLCTGYSETLEAQQIATDHFAAILHKPLKRTMLAQSVRNALDGVPFYPSSNPPEH